MNKTQIFNQMNGIQLIAQERKEQIEKHGVTPQMDVRFNSTLTRYDECYPLVLGALSLINKKITWTPDHWSEQKIKHMLRKPYKDRLVIAAALLAAEIDRIIEIEKINRNANNGNIIIDDFEYTDTTDVGI